MEVNKRCLWLFAFQLFWFLCLVESYPEGVNFYKDWLRNKNEDDVERMIAEDQFEAPKLFFTGRQARSPILGWENRWRNGRSTDTKT